MTAVTGDYNDYMRKMRKICWKMRKMRKCLEVKHAVGSRAQ